MWARSSNGMLPKTDGGWTTWQDVSRDRAEEGNIKWAELKAVDRAIEKVLRVYGEDYSYLVDICRQSLVFENIQDLISCLHAIGTDTEVLVLRIKNRMDPRVASSTSAGFRNVSLNLRIVSDQARDLGVETHVCEVQLLLKEFAEMLHATGGHQRYVDFRNARGE